MLGKNIHRAVAVLRLIDRNGAKWDELHKKLEIFTHYDEFAAALSFGILPEFSCIELVKDDPIPSILPKIDYVSASQFVPLSIAEIVKYRTLSSRWQSEHLAMAWWCGPLPYNCAFGSRDFIVYGPQGNTKLVLDALLDSVLVAKIDEYRKEAYREPANQYAGRLTDIFSSIEGEEFSANHSSKYIFGIPKHYDVLKNPFLRSLARDWSLLKDYVELASELSNKCVVKHGRSQWRCEIWYNIDKQEHGHTFSFGEFNKSDVVFQIDLPTEFWKSNGGVAALSIAPLRNYSEDPSTSTISNRPEILISRRINE